MRPPAIQETEADRSAAAAIWTTLAQAWDRKADLAQALGVHRTAVQHWTSGTRAASWGALRGALRATAARWPRAVPALVETLARELLDVEGTWVPDVDVASLAGVAEEVGDVTVACGALLAAARRGASTEEVDALTRSLVREVHEAAAAARAVC